MELGGKIQAHSFGWCLPPCGRDLQLCLDLLCHYKEGSGCNSLMEEKDIQRIERGGPRVCAISVTHLSKTVNFNGKSVCAVFVADGGRPKALVKEKE